MCARGILLSDISFDFVRSEITLATQQNWPKVARLFETLREQATAWLEQEGVSPELRKINFSIDARYEGQNFEVQVPQADIGGEGADGVRAFLAGFAEAHEREYGYVVDGRAVQIINCRAQAVGQVIKAPLARHTVQGSIEDARIGERRAYFGAVHGWVDTPVYERTKLPTGATLTGPALVEEMSSTTVIGVNHHATVDDYGNLIILLQGANHG